MKSDEREEILARMLEDAAMMIRELVEENHREAHFREIDFLEDIEGVLGKEIR